MSEIEYVKVDTNELAGMKEELNTYITEIVSGSESMYLTFGSLRDSFQGAPADAFFSAVAADLQELDRAIAALRALWQYEDRAYEQYETCERVVSGIVGDMC